MNRWYKLDAPFVASIVIALAMFMVMDPANLTPPPFYNHIPPPAIARYCVITDGPLKGMRSWGADKRTERPDESCTDAPNPMGGPYNGGK